MTHPSELLPYLEVFLLQLTTASLLVHVAICGPFSLLLPPSTLQDFLEPSSLFSPTLPALISGGVNDFEVLPEVVSVPAAPPLLWVLGKSSIKNTRVQYLL
ncbi:hypothetical protein SCLCIDRAFT_34863 [Scleroderma citrinum Foug A]|uniref:Uncharacterized protein n=1 Tax=Scleroderma citrinum Foug A TaxID=1036808 RepID=A0A0C3D0M9_9AGAM|nr:hypothetical protein SCLCIDRAFT_34863 [Scleroderma citrinum Foug A]